MIQSKDRLVTNEVISLVTNFFGLPMYTICKKTTNRTVSQARGTVMYIVDILNKAGVISVSQVSMNEMLEESIGKDSIYYQLRKISDLISIKDERVIKCIDYYNLNCKESNKVEIS